MSLPSWEESRLAIEQRFDTLEERLRTIEGGIWKLIWAVLAGVLATVGHAVMTFLQMRGH